MKRYTTPLKNGFKVQRNIPDDGFTWVIMGDFTSVRTYVKKINLSVRIFKESAVGIHPVYFYITITHRNNMSQDNYSQLFSPYAAKEIVDNLHIICNHLPEFSVWLCDALQHHPFWHHNIHKS